MQTARCPFRPAGRQSLRLGRWDGLDDAEQALGVGVISPALFAAWGLQFQPVTKRHGLAALGIEALFEFAPGGTCIQARSQDGTNIHYGKPPFLVVPDAANAGLLENGDVVCLLSVFCAFDHFPPPLGLYWLKSAVQASARFVEVSGNTGSPNGWDTRTWGLHFFACLIVKFSINSAEQSSPSAPCSQSALPGYPAKTSNRSPVHPF